MIGDVFIGGITTSLTATVTTQSGSVYTTAATSSINYPVTMNNVVFTDVKVLFGAPLWTIIYSATTSAVYYRLCASTSRTTSTAYTIKAFVFGLAARS